MATRAKSSSSSTTKAAPPRAKPKPAPKAKAAPAADAAPDVSDTGAAGAAAPDAAQQAAHNVRLSAQHIWQAGLAAFAKAQEEGGRVFSKMVQEGSELHQRGKPVAGDQADGAAGADGVAAPQASGSWDKLEQVFEERVARALAKIGVPAQGELEALRQRVELLSAQVAALSAALSAAAAPAPAAGKAAPKAAPKTRRSPPA